MSGAHCDLELAVGVLISGTWLSSSGTSRMRSGSAHWDLEFAVEVRQFPLRSGARGWRLAVRTEIWQPQFRSGGVYWDLELAVEVRQCPQLSGARSWGAGGGGRKEEEVTLIKSGGLHLTGGKNYPSKVSPEKDGNQQVSRGPWWYLWAMQSDSSRNPWDLLGTCWWHPSWGSQKWLKGKCSKKKHISMNLLFGDGLMCIPPIGVYIGDTFLCCVSTEEYLMRDLLSGKEEEELWNISLSFPTKQGHWLRQPIQKNPPIKQNAWEAQNCLRERVVKHVCMLYSKYIYTCIHTWH